MKTLQEIVEWINYHTDADAQVIKNPPDEYQEGGDFVSITFLSVNKDVHPDTYEHIYISDPAEFEMLEQEILIGCDAISYFDSPEHREEVTEEYLKQFRGMPAIPF